MKHAQLTSEDVANLRSENGLTQERLADLLSVTTNTIQYWESGKKFISPHNQEKITRLVRKLWIEQIFKINSFSTPSIECTSLHALLKNGEDDVAIELAEHFVKVTEPETLKRALMHHFVSVVYVITKRDAETALIHCRRALDILTESDFENNNMRASVENTLIGESIESILSSKDSFGKQRRAIPYIRALFKLYEKRSMPQYLWNALGLACGVSLDDKEEIVKSLIDAEGIDEVYRRVFTYEHLEEAKPTLQNIMEKI